MQTATFRTTLAAIAAAGGVGRIALVRLIDRAPGGDGFFFPLRAANLVDGHGFATVGGAVQGVYRPTAGYPPLWTLVLAIPAWFHHREFVTYQVLGALIGVATIVVVGLAAKEVAGRRVGLLAAAIAAVYPGFWSYERAVLSETLLLLVLAAMILLAYRYHRRPTLPGAVLLGVGWMVCTLTRAEQLLLWPLVVAPLVLTTAGLAWRARIGRLAVATIVGLVLLAPWTIYNAGRFEAPVLLSNGLGNAMEAGACDAAFSGDLYGYYDPVSCVMARPPASTDEAVADGQKRSIALRYLREHIREVPLVVAAREGRTFGLFRPGQTMDLYMTWSGGSTAIGWSWVISYWVLLGAAIGGVVQLRRRRVLIYPLLAGAVTVVISTALTFGFIRYRAAAEVGLVILAAVGIDAFCSLVARRFRRRGMLRSDDRLDAATGTDERGHGDEDLVVGLTTEPTPARPG